LNSHFLNTFFSAPCISNSVSQRQSRLSFSLHVKAYGLFKILGRNRNCNPTCWTEIGNVMWKRLTVIVSCILQYLNPLCGCGPTICGYWKPKYIRGRFTLLSGYNSLSRCGNILVRSNLHLSYLRNGRLISGRACCGRELPIRG